MSVDFDMSELSRLADDLGKVAPRVKRASSAEMTRIAAQLRDDAQAAAPVDTEALRDSIKVRGGADYRIVLADVRHAFFVEFGTSDTAPQPFLWPQAPKAARALEEALGDVGADVF